MFEMNRQFSSNNSLNLIEWEVPSSSNIVTKCNSLVEMFDPIYDKFPTESKKAQSTEISSSCEDIFSPVIQEEPCFQEFCNGDEMFKEPENGKGEYESIYPSLSTFRSSFDLDDRHSIFTMSINGERQEQSFDLRPSIFHELRPEADNKSMFNDSYANRDMEGFMKMLTEFHIQTMCLQDDERSHMIFDCVLPLDFGKPTGLSDTMQIEVFGSEKNLIGVESYSSVINPYSTTERQIVATIASKQLLGVSQSLLFFRIKGRGEYLRQGDFPFILNQYILNCYRTQTTVKLRLEFVDCSDSLYRLNESVADVSSRVYQILENDFHWISRFQLENSLLDLMSYRNSIVTTLKDYRSQYLDVPSLEASIGVFKNKCRSICILCDKIYTASIAEKMVLLDQITHNLFRVLNKYDEISLASSIDALIKCLDNTSRLVTQFLYEITIYCNSNFSVRNEKLSVAGCFSSESGVQLISKYRTPLFIKLKSLCGMPVDESYTNFSIRVSVKVGSQSFTKFACCDDRVVDSRQSSLASYQTIHADFPVCIPFNETIDFDNLSMNCLSRDTSLYIVFTGYQVSHSGENQMCQERRIGWAQIPLFDPKGMLKQGSLLIGLHSGHRQQKWCFGMNRSKSSMVLEIELPVFHVPVKCVNQSEHMEMPEANDCERSLKMIETGLENIFLKRNSTKSQQIAQFLWSNRKLLLTVPRRYVGLCIAVAFSSPTGKKMDDRSYLIDYLSYCHSKITVSDITILLHFLGPLMPLGNIRRWAVDRIKEMSSDICIQLIPDLVEALKYESTFNSSGIEELLLEFSLRNINFSTKLFWHLSSIESKDIHGYKSILLLSALRSLVNSAVEKMWQYQLSIVEHLQKTATAVKSFKSPAGDKKSVLYTNLEELYDLLFSRVQQSTIHPLSNYRIPYQPGLQLMKLDIKDCSYFNSFTLPLRIVFKGLDATSIEVMFKSGDDLRQDILVLRLFRLMDDIWTSEGHDFRMVHYRVMSTGERCGLIELVGDCTTLSKIQKSKGGIAAPLTTVDAIAEWLRCQNTTSSAYLKSVENFLLTGVACCVSTYLLGIGDRHNDNIMIQTSGRMFHIDFAKIFGDAQTFAGIKRDRVAFVLTQDMVHVLQDYKSSDDDKRTGMQIFIDKCCEAFNIIRRHWCSLISILTMAAEANIPGVNYKTIHYLVKMLRLDCSEIEASEYFTDLIRKCCNSISTPVNFLIHNLAQMKYSSNKEGNLFTFTPKVYGDGPRIVQVCIKYVQKIRQPNKHYAYQTWVTKEGEEKQVVVFRRYEHFIELAQQLSELFPLSELPKSCQAVIQAGPPSSLALAESRRSILQKFLNTVLSLEDEISQCNLMQTFFHSILTDEEKINQYMLYQSKSKSLRNAAKPEIQLKFKFSYSKLEIFVKHGRNLVSPRLVDPPNAYVKTYLFPNGGFSSKRKTGTISRNSCPSFNDIITYEKADIKPNMKLEVSVWHYEIFGENFCIGFLLIPISDDLPINETWYTLSCKNVEERT